MSWFDPNAQNMNVTLLQMKIMATTKLFPTALVRRYAVMPNPALTIGNSARLIGDANLDLADSSPEDVVRWASSIGPVAMSSSFGTQSAVLLHMATQIIPDIPVIMVDTG